MADDQARDGRWYAKFATVHVRTTLAATLIVAIALSIGAVAFVSLLRAELIDGQRASAEQRLTAFEEAVEDSNDVSALLDGGEDDEDEEFVQLVDASGKVTDSTENVEGAAAILPDGDDDTRTVPAGDGEYLVVAETFDGSDDDSDSDSDSDSEESDATGETTVVVGRSLEDVSESGAAVTRLLAAGVPMLVAIVGLTTWFVVGRALAPVDRIRREVDEISGSQLHRRVEAPPRNDEIGRLARTMNRMLQRIDGAQRRQRQFVSDASHELRSPVASIRQHAEVARAYPQRADAAELAETVQQESVRMQRIVEALLLLARSDERSIVTTTQSVDLDDLALTEVRRMRDAGGVKVDASGIGAGRVTGDPGLLGQLLRNLMDNAARHANSTVALEVRDTADGVLVAVEDDGAGISPEDRERVFERFVRLDEARARDGGGSGLGLAIVREIATAHGGAVRAVDGRAGGARFEVRLPHALTP